MHVFISYSHTDKAYAHKLAASLEQGGIDAWVDDRIDYGDQWPTIIQDHLDASKAVIVVMTPRSYKSEWVQNELSRARRKKKPIFPLLLEGEVWLSVEATQYVDVLNGSLPETSFYKRVKRIIEKEEPRTGQIRKPDRLTLKEIIYTYARRTSKTGIVGLGFVTLFLAVLFILKPWQQQGSSWTFSDHAQNTGTDPNNYSNKATSTTPDGDFFTRIVPEMSRKGDEVYLHLWGLGYNYQDVVTYKDTLTWEWRRNLYRFFITEIQLEDHHYDSKVFYTIQKNHGGITGIVENPVAEPEMPATRGMFQQMNDGSCKQGNVYEAGFCRCSEGYTARISASFDDSKMYYCTKDD